MEAILAIAIPIFLNYLAGCLQRRLTPADVKSAATAAFNTETGTFKPEVIREHRGRMKRCCKRAGQPHDRDSVDAATVEMLTRAMNSDDHVLAAACADAHGDDSDDE